MKIERFEDLTTWKEARELCIMIKEITSYEAFAKDFKFRDQIRSSSGSIMDNISEGFERSGKNEFIQFLSIAKGSCGEVRSQAYRAFDFKYISQDELNDLLLRTESLGKKIGSFINYLQKSEYTGSKFQYRHKPGNPNKDQNP